MRTSSVSSYACAMRCPVLTEGWGTAGVHRIQLLVLIVNSGFMVRAYTRAMLCPVLTLRIILSAYAPALRCPVLRYRTDTPGQAEAVG
eukprot:1361791-Rhodomonas_salina.6